MKSSFKTSSFTGIFISILKLAMSLHGTRCGSINCSAFAFLDKPGIGHSERDRSRDGTRGESKTGKTLYRGNQSLSPSNVKVSGALGYWHHWHLHHQQGSRNRRWQLTVNMFLLELQSNVDYIQFVVFFCQPFFQKHRENMANLWLEALVPATVIASWRWSQ